MRWPGMARHLLLRDSTGFHRRNQSPINLYVKRNTKTKKAFTPCIRLKAKNFQEHAQSASDADQDISWENTSTDILVAIVALRATNRNKQF